MLDVPNPPNLALLPAQRRDCSLDLPTRIRNAMIIVAKLLAKGGEEYLPLYERLERELLECEQKEQTLQRAIALAENAVYNTRD